MVLPFDVRIYSGDFDFLGLCNAPESLKPTVRHNAIGTLDITVPNDSPKEPLLATEGARVKVTYLGEFLMSGPIRGVSGTGDTASGSVTFTVEDDKRLLWRMLGWPNPTGAISAQGAVTAYKKRTGPAETVLKAFVAENATRLGLPVTIAPDLGRGATITVQMRMHNLAERLLPVIEAAGIGFTVEQSGAGFLLDCYEPQTFPRTLTELGGVIRTWSLQRTPHTATRTVIGAQGEGTAREFRQIIDSALETSTGDIIEVFTDARDTNVTAEIDQRGTDALAEAAPTSGFKVELAETKSFRYGGAGIHVGDLVTLKVGGTTFPPDILREVSFSWTRDGGLEVTPTAGGWDGDPTVRLGKLVAKAFRSLKNVLLS